MSESIQLILALQDYDMRAQELIRKLTDIPDIIQQLEYEIQIHKTQWQQKEEAILQLKKIVRDLEQELRCIGEQIAQDKNKINLTRTQKEYDAISRKINDQTESIKPLEEECLTKLLEIDEMNIQLEQEQPTHEEAIAKLRQTQDEQQKMVLSLKENCNEVNGKMAVIRNILKEQKPTWLEHYDTTRKAISKMPCVVSLQNNQYCGGCNLKLSSYIYTVNDEFPFVTCESCARLVLIPPESIINIHDEDDVIL